MCRNQNPDTALDDFVSCDMCDADLHAKCVGQVPLPSPVLCKTCVALVSAARDAKWPLPLPPTRKWVGFTQWGLFKRDEVMTLQFSYVDPRSRLASGGAWAAGDVVASVSGVVTERVFPSRAPPPYAESAQSRSTASSSSAGSGASSASSSPAGGGAAAAAAATAATAAEKRLVVRGVLRLVAVPPSSSHAQAHAHANAATTTTTTAKHSKTNKPTTDAGSASGASASQGGTATPMDVDSNELVFELELQREWESPE